MKIWLGHWTVVGKRVSGGLIFAKATPFWSRIKLGCGSFFRSYHCEIGYSDNHCEAELPRCRHGLVGVFQVELYHETFLICSGLAAGLFCGTIQIFIAE